MFKSREVILLELPRHSWNSSKSHAAMLPCPPRFLGFGFVSAVKLSTACTTYSTSLKRPSALSLHISSADD
jgi:hypothetical protein